MTIPKIANENAVAVVVSTSVAVSATPLRIGVYALWATVDTFIKADKVSGVSDDVTTSSGYKIKADDIPVGIEICEPCFLAAIAAEDGTLYYHKVK